MGRLPGACSASRGILGETSTELFYPGSRGSDVALLMIWILRPWRGCGIIRIKLPRKLDPAANWFATQERPCRLAIKSGWYVSLHCGVSERQRRCHGKHQVVAILPNDEECLTAQAISSM